MDNADGAGTVVVMLDNADGVDTGVVMVDNADGVDTSVTVDSADGAGTGVVIVDREVARLSSWTSLTRPIRGHFGQEILDTPVKAGRSSNCQGLRQQ